MSRKTCMPEHNDMRKLLRGRFVWPLALLLSLTLAACSGSSSSADNSGSAQDDVAAETSSPETDTEDSGTDAADADASAEQSVAFDNWTSSSTDSPANWKWVVSKIGSFKGEKGDVNVSFKSVPFDASNTHVLATDGTLIMDGAEFDPENCAVLASEYEVYYLASTDEGPNHYGLATPDGEVLIDCEAAAMGGSPNAYGQFRFLAVAYLGDEVSEPSESTVEVDGTNYEVSEKVYDLERKAFVEGFELASNDFEIYNLGDRFAIKSPEGGGKTSLYDEDGNLVWSCSDKYAEVGPDCISFSNYPHESIVDTSGNVTFTAGDGDILSSISTDLGSQQISAFWAYKESGEENYIIIDKNGKQVVDGSYSNVYGEADGIFEVKLADSEQKAVINMAGKQLSIENPWVERVVPGYVSVGGDLYHGSEMISEGSGSAVRPSNDRSDILVLSTGKMVYFDRIDALDIALSAGMGSKDANYGVWDLFTGKKIIEANYESIQAAGSTSYVGGSCYIFAYGQSEWDVFEARRVPA